MPIRNAILPWLRLTLLLAMGLGAWVRPGSALVVRPAKQLVQTGHEPFEQYPQLTGVNLLEQAALVPAAPDVPAGLSGGALLPTLLGWLRVDWSAAIGLPSALRPRAMPGLFRVRLLLVALAPNAP